MTTLNNILHNEVCEPDIRGLGVVFLEKMKKNKDRIGQIDSVTGKTMTYNEILLKSIRVANELTARNITANDVVTVCSYNNMDNAIPLYACLFLGIPVACMDPALTKGDIKLLLCNVKPRLYFCDSDGLALMEPILKETGDVADIVVFDESETYSHFSEFLVSSKNETSFQVKPVIDVFSTALIFFSSGSLGLPKAIRLSHYGLLAQTIYYRSFIDTSVTAHFPNFFCCTAFMLLSWCILSGGRRVVCKYFDETTVMNIIQDYKVSVTFFSPTQSYLLTKKYKNSNFNTKALKSLLIAGGIISESQMKALRQLFLGTNIHFCYGMTEASGVMTIFNSKCDQLLMDKYSISCGRPVPGFSFKIVNCSTGQICGPNEPGEIRVKSKCLFVGLHNNEKCMKTLWDEDGFMYTGDYGYYNEEQCFFVLDRIKSLVKYKGWHMFPTEIEKVLMDNSDVQEAVVVGIPHEEDGEHPAALVVLRPGAKITQNELFKYVDDIFEGCERRKLRGGIIILKEIPKTPSGKPKRMFLRDLAMNSSI